MTPKRAKDLSGKKITSYEQIQDEYQSLFEQVRFGPPVWDRRKKRYFRLSTSMVFSDSWEEKGSFLPEIKGVKAYLSVFDADINLIPELVIPELSTEYVKYFAKDEKLWVFKNFSDELGFIVIDFWLIEKIHINIIYWSYKNELCIYSCNGRMVWNVFSKNFKNDILLNNKK